ncbi:hypothetical protein [Spirochaeta isovalerica]|uniref:Uncharacterized protein n=1 Tax=Spirochaeta isovalerica TaxID=150 RepID=A0A841R6B6_9SPIO|nr:hypothetical protein [Spirochaeta isovalerica]MBB6478590.1 hypothetical protein [Spirochaeta isovalerica]
MIFFLTTLIPSSNIESDIRKFKTHLYRQGILIPLPLTIITVSLTKELPRRPERKRIAKEYPSLLTPGSFKTEDKALKMDFCEELPFHSDFDIPFISYFSPGAWLLGELAEDESDNSVKSDFAVKHFPPFSKYSLAAYRIRAASTKDWWKSMDWEKMWEVKKGSDRIEGN